MAKASDCPLIKPNKRNYRKKSSLNLKTYLESGVLELYVLDLLPEAERMDVEQLLAVYPELVIEIAQIQATLEKDTMANALTPPSYLKQKVIDTIENLEKEKLMDSSDLPLINSFSNHHNWLKLVASFGQLDLVNGMHVKVLRKDEHISQLLIISETPIPEETHENEYESFLILSGECKCTVGNKITYMKAGDFMEIPLFETHHVALISPQVTAILQHIRL